MKKITQIGLNVILLGIFTYPNKVNANTEIQWQEVPGASLNQYGESSILVGTNTISRNGDSINFDVFLDFNYAYARMAGNCKTGWLSSIASGHYTEGGELVVTPNSSESSGTGVPQLALSFACSLN